MFNTALREKFCANRVNNFILLLVKAYSIAKDEPLVINKENNRRNQLVNKMRKIKSEFGIEEVISTYDEVDQDYNTIGMTDISFIFGSFEDKKITFECKRIKDNAEICPSHIQNEYISKGLNRFVNEKYTVDFSVAGMISFIESGDSLKCFNLIEKELSCVWGDRSLSYNHNYVAQSSHKTINGKGFDVYHLIFDFN